MEELPLIALKSGWASFRKQVEHDSLFNECLTAISGDPCPCSGEWEIVGMLSTSAVCAAGSEMPQYYGKRVVWMLVRRE